jgi:hypothetical protein
MQLASAQFRNRVLLPITALLLAAWVVSGLLMRKDADLARQSEAVRKELRAGGFEPDAGRIEERTAAVRLDTEKLREYMEAGRMLAADKLVRERGTQPFQLLEFERERADAEAAALQAASAAGVKVEPSAFAVLADTSESPLQPRRRWAQLALARETVRRAITAKVATYEALPVPAVREIRLDAGSPVLADEILFSVRVTGDSARVQDFVESIALGGGKDDARFFIEHIVLRKDGTQAPDQASATVVLAALLPPLPREESP